MRPLHLFAAVSVAAAASCVSRTTPLRPRDTGDVGGTRVEAVFRAARPPLEGVLLAREYLVGQGLTLLDAGAADRLEVRHPFLDDRYRVTVTAEGEGSRIRVEGWVSGRDDTLQGRLDALARGLRRRLDGSTAP